MKFFLKIKKKVTSSYISSLLAVNSIDINSILSKSKSIKQTG